jgi:hypothetical protein
MHLLKRPVGQQGRKRCWSGPHQDPGVSVLTCMQVAVADVSLEAPLSRTYQRWVWLFLSSSAPLHTMGMEAAFGVLAHGLP